MKVHNPAMMSMALPALKSSPAVSISPQTLSGTRLETPGCALPVKVGGMTSECALVRDSCLLVCGCACEGVWVLAHAHVCVGTRTRVCWHMHTCVLAHAHVCVCGWVVACVLWGMGGATEQPTVLHSQSHPIRDSVL